MSYRIFTTNEFDKDFNRLDGGSKERVRKILNQLKERGDDVGKPLRYPYFKEKKFDNKRLYFLVYKDQMIILAIAISDKKTQRETIDEIISELKKYKRIIDERLKDL